MFGLVPWRKKDAVERFGDGAELAPFGQFRTEMDHLFDRFFQGWPSTLEGLDRGWGLDVQDKEDAVVVKAEAPGFEAGDFDLNVTGNQLSLHAFKKAESEDKDRGAREWSRHELHRSVTLPAGINPDKVEAKYRNGILTVTLPKTEEGKGKRIAVKA